MDMQKPYPEVAVSKVWPREPDRCPMLFKESKELNFHFQMFKLDLEKAEEPESKLPISAGSLEKQENTGKTSTFASLIMLNPLTV